MQPRVHYPQKPKLVNVTNFNFCSIKIPRAQKVTQALETMHIMAGSNNIKLCKINEFKRVEFLIEQAIKRN